MVTGRRLPTRKSNTATSAPHMMPCTKNETETENENENAHTLHAYTNAHTCCTKNENAHTCLHAYTKKSFKQKLQLHVYRIQH